MKKLRIWAILILAIYLLGVAIAGVAFFAHRDDLTVYSIALIGLGIVGTMQLKKMRDNQHAIDRMRKQQENIEVANRNKESQKQEDDCDSF